jgi:hypothetical protein
LAPLRFGAGIKGKLIDAMYSGTPSITTSIGAEAMAAANPSSPQPITWGGVVTDNIQAFVAAAVQLHEDPRLWQLAQQRGALILRERFDRRDFVGSLTTKLCSVREQLAQRRRNNFIGAMLQHHQHKSTHYMAKNSIEANSIKASNSLEANTSIEATNEVPSTAAVKP